MNKKEAEEAMYAGHKVRHTYYDKDEYVYMNPTNCHLITEDGYDHGTVFGEFWTEYQVWNEGWEIVEKNDLIPFVSKDNSYAEQSINFFNKFPNYQDSFYHCEPRRVTPVPQRNEPCSCNSGLKYKKCCGKK